MINLRRLYNVGYRFFRLGSGRAIDLGCGTGANALYLAAHGFDVTGVDLLLGGPDQSRSGLRSRRCARQLGRGRPRRTARSRRLIAAYLMTRR